MHQIGVMPMPPANRTRVRGVFAQAEIVAGAADLQRRADRNSSWMKREPPRLAGSRLMPTV